MSIQIRRGPIAADNFSIISNALIRDNSISLQARGLLVWLLSHRADFSLTMERIAAMTGAGVTRVRAAITELEKAGYLVREQRRAKGRFGDELYHVTDCPVRPSVDFPPTVSPHTENTVYGESADIRRPFNDLEDHFPEEDHLSSGDDATDPDPLEAVLDEKTPTTPERDTTTEDLLLDESSVTPEPDPSPPKPEDRFEEFYAAYPRHVGRGQAERAWKKATTGKVAADPGAVIAAASAFTARRKGQDPTFTPHPATWLNGKRWLDDDVVGAYVGGQYHRVTAADEASWDEYR